jgi:uncharacterized membrane protein
LSDETENPDEKVISFEDYKEKRSRDKRDSDIDIESLAGATRATWIENPTPRELILVEIIENLSEYVTFLITEMDADPSVKRQKAPLILKVVCWRLISILITLAVMLIMTGDVKSATGLTISLHILLTGANYMFERVWRRYEK